MKLFFALKMDIEALPNMKQALIKLKRDASDKEWDIKFTQMQNFHVTIRYIGETKTENIDQIKEIGQKIAQRHAAFPLHISGFDAFPEIHQARVIWAGVQNKKNLQALHEDLEQELAHLDLPIEHSFIPHLTVARLRNPRSVRSYLSPFERKSFGSIQCKELGLYKSELRGNYPHYELIEKFEFLDMCPLHLETVP